MDYIRIDDLITEGNARPEEFIQAEFAQSIRDRGVRVPVLIYTDLLGGKVLWDGGRRVLAARLAGLEEVPYSEVDPPLDSADAAAAQIIFNNFRQELSYLQRAGVIKRMKDTGLLQVDIAERLSMSESEISTALKAINAHPDVQKALEEGRISPSAVEPILVQSWEDQERLIGPAVAAKTVRKVRALVNADRMQQNPKVRETDIPEELDPLELLVLDELEEAMRHLRTVQEAELTNAGLRRQARKSVAQLVQMAVQLGEEWSDE